MNAASPEELIKTALYTVAPDLEGQSIDPAARYVDQFEFDSMDFLHFVVELHRRTGLDIPEAEYPRLQTLDAGVAWLRGKLPSGG